MKVAIITGAGSGIGLETAKLLHQAGVAVVGVGRDVAKLARLEAAIGDPAMVATLSVAPSHWTRRLAVLTVSGTLLMALPLAGTRVLFQRVTRI